MLEVLKVRVSLPSGRWEDVSVPVNGRIFDLKMAAQQSLEQSFLKLAGPDGRLLDPTKSLQSAWLKDGDTIAAVAQQPRIAATSSAFALWCRRGQGCYVGQFVPRRWHLCPWRGVLPFIMPVSVVSVIMSGTSWRMSSRSTSRRRHLQRLWQMDWLWRGAMRIATVIALESGNSSRTSSGFLLRSVLLLRFWQTRVLWHGAVQVMVVTAPASEISLRTFRSDVGPCRQFSWQHESPGSAPESPADSCHRWCFCSNFARWLGGDVGQSADSRHKFFVRCDLGRQKCCGLLVVAKARKLICWETFGKFMQRASLLLRFWQTEVLWPGASRSMAVTAPKFRISSGTLLRSWRIKPLWCGAMTFWTLKTFKVGSLWCSSLATCFLWETRSKKGVISVVSEHYLLDSDLESSNLLNLSLEHKSILHHPAFIWFGGFSGAVVAPTLFLSQTTVSHGSPEKRYTF